MDSHRVNIKTEIINDLIYDIEYFIGFVLNMRCVSPSPDSRKAYCNYVEIYQQPSPTPIIVLLSLLILFTLMKLIGFWLTALFVILI